MNSGGPPPTHGKHSPKSAEPMKVSRQSSEDKLYSAETKLESSDDFNIPDLSSAINFSKFMNKSRAESKEMMMGGEDDGHIHQSHDLHHNNNRVADAKHEYKEEPVHNQYKHHHVEEEPEEIEEVEEEEEEEDDEYNFDYSKSKLLNKDRLAPLPSHDTINTTAVNHSHHNNHDHHNHTNLRDKLDRRASEESDDFTDDYEEILYKKDKHSNNNNLVESKTDDHHHPHNTHQEEEDFSHSQPKHSTVVPHTVPVHEEKHKYDEEEEEEAVEEVLEEIAENLEELSHEFEESKQSGDGLIEPPFPTRSVAKGELTPPTSVSPKSPSDFKSHSHSRSHDEKLDYQPSRRGEPLPSLYQKKPLSSSLPALGELKVPNRSNPPSFLEEKKHMEEKEPAGPELDSDEGEEEDYSQLDQEISQEIANKSFEKGELLPQDNFPHVQSKVVASKYDDGSQSNSNRVSVNRLNQQGVIRSTKGWNDIDERRYEGFDAEEDVDDEDETDQTELPLQQQHSKNVLPGRHPTHHHQPPARNLQLLDADDSRNSHDISFSQDDQEADNHPTEQNENILNSSYRSNQEEEEDEGKEIVINHEEEEGEDFYEDEDEEAEETPIVFEKPKHSLFVSKDSGRQETTTTHHSHHHQEPAFTMTSKNKQKDPEEDEDEEEEEQNYDDYGDDFENEDEHNTSRLSHQGKKGTTSTTATTNHPPKRAEEKEDEMEDIEEDIEEDIPEEEEEEEDEGKGKDEMSVGGNVSILIYRVFLVLNAYPVISYL
jgi:hypothetical protein